MGDDGPGVAEVIISEQHLKERDGSAPRGPGDKVEMVTHGSSMRTRPYGDHRYAYKSNHGTVTKVTLRRDPKTGEVRKLFHVKPE